MCYIKRLILFIFLLFVYSVSQTQVIYHDGIIRYTITVVGTENTFDSIKRSELNVFLRGMQSKTEFISPLGKSVTYYDEKKGLATQLNEYGRQKTMTKMNDTQYKELNRYKSDYTIEIMPDKKNIEGYTCLQAKIIFKNAQSILVYFTHELVFQTSYNPLYVTLPGFPLEFETESGGQKINYKARSVSTNTVPASQFDIQEKDYMEVDFRNSKGN